MARIANNISNLAGSAGAVEPGLKVSFSFLDEWRGKVSPLLSTVCCFPLHARRVGHCRRIPTWALEYHSRNAGKLYLGSLSGTPLYREPGTVHLYAPGCDYWEDSHEADLPVQETYWLFSGGEGAGLERFVNNPERFARFSDPENLIGKLMLESARFCNDRGQGAFWMAQSLFAAALFQLAGSRKTGAYDYLVSSSEPRPSFGFRVEQYLRRNFSESIDLADIAHYMRTSPSLLSHKFKAEMGRSPIARLIEIRIEHARSLLMKGEKLKSIAALTGHSSEYHLSRNFKAVTGVSPARFRLLQPGQALH